ncbi:MAG TPA: hypothetical protein VFK17_02860 [Gaiellaceae bacterium]|nr:hypothetical protein [Gaiellaceae bacterium]
MREPDQRDRHDPPGVATALVAAAAAGLVLACVSPAYAAAPRQAALPSPTAPLTAAPPLGGGATASAENVRHQVSSHVDVDVSLDAAGTVFAVAATQRLDVRGQGDYYFRIGAPATDVRAAAGSAALPGLRTGTILWAGFDPGRRVLAARAGLDPAAVRPQLPLRVVRGTDGTTLVNATGTTVATYTADAERAPLLAYLAALREDLARGRPPRAGFAGVTSQPTPTRMTVRAPLHVTGTIGGRRVDLELDRRAVVPATGVVDLRVTPRARLEVGDVSRLGGRQLLAAAIRASLVVARARQYDAFLGNPDPVGASRTTYTYRTARRAAPAAVVAVPSGGRSALEITLIAVAAAAGLAAAAVLWARS